MLQLGNGFFQQKVGIAQGSILSSLLCSFYYGHLERNMIYPFLDKVCDTSFGDFSGICNYCGASASGRVCGNELMGNSKYILLRLIDDFLFVSTSRNQASLFKFLLQRGFSEYNCYMNEGKFGSNFGKDQISSSRFCIGEDGISFLRWSGVLVNCSTLEIQADYMRWVSSQLRWLIWMLMFAVVRILLTQLFWYSSSYCNIILRGMCLRNMHFRLLIHIPVQF